MQGREGERTRRTSKCSKGQVPPILVILELHLLLTQSDQRARVLTWRISPPAHRGEVVCCNRKVGVGKPGFLVGNWAGRGKP